MKISVRFFVFKMEPANHKVYYLFLAKHRLFYIIFYFIGHINSFLKVLHRTVRLLNITNKRVQMYPGRSIAKS